MKIGRSLLFCCFSVTFACCAQAQTQVRIGFAVPKTVSDVGAYAAEALGYFKKANLDVKLAAYSGGNQAQEILSGGGADIIGYFPGGVGLAVSKGAKEKIVGTIDAAPDGFYLLVRPDSHIKTLKNLQGATVGISGKGSEVDMLSLWTARKAGVKIKAVPVGGPAMVPLLLRRQVDAIIQFPLAPYRLMKEGKARAIFNYSTMKPIISDCFVASQEMMDNHPAALRATLAAIYRGLAYMRNHRNWGLQFLKKFTGETDDAVIAEAYKGIVMKLSTDGKTNPAWIDYALALSADAWNKPELKHVKADQIYTNKFLNLKVH